MAAEIRKLAEQFEDRYPEMAAYLNLGARMAPRLGVPESLTDGIPAVNKETYKRILEAVEVTGYNFVAPIRPVSVNGLLMEDGQRKSKRLGYVNESEVMRAVVPPEMKIVINPNKFRIKGSNNLSTEEQKKKIQQEETEWKDQLPEDIRPFVSMRMVDPSVLCQLEDAYMDKNEGKLLLPNWFARTDVHSVPGSVADVGRDDPTYRRYVGDWYRGLGRRRVFAVSVVVLPRELAV